MFIHSQFQFSIFYWTNIIFKHASCDKIKYLSIISFQTFCISHICNFQLFDYTITNFRFLNCEKPNFSSKSIFLKLHNYIIFAIVKFFIVFIWHIIEVYAKLFLYLFNVNSKFPGLVFNRFSLFCKQLFDNKNCKQYYLKILKLIKYSFNFLSI